MRVALALMTCAAVALAAAACGGAAATPSPSPTTVNADEKEFSITLDKSSAPAGAVSFKVSNSGTIVHEFVVIDTDTPAGQLPVGDGSVVSEEGVTVVDEIEDIAAGANPELTVTLTAGHYAIICNVPGHYVSGMHADFTVQ